MLIVNQGSAAVVGGPRLTFLCNVYAFRTVIFSSHVIRRAMMNLIDFGAFPAKETPRPVQSMAAASVAARENTGVGIQSECTPLYYQEPATSDWCCNLHLSGVPNTECHRSKHFSSCREKSIDSSTAACISSQSSSTATSRPLDRRSTMRLLRDGTRRMKKDGRTPQVLQGWSAPALNPDACFAKQDRTLAGGE